MVNTNLNSSSRRKTAIIVTSVAVLAVAVGMLILKHNNDAEEAKHTTTIPSQKHSVADSPNTSEKVTSNQGNDEPNSRSEKSPTPTTTKTLLTPSSDGLVSNHRPSTASPGEQSVCSTTPGATCYISLTRDGVTKKLDAQTTDVNGFAYWTWDINTAGVTTGSWTVTAAATLNGQTKSTQDPIDLVVQS